MVGTHQLSVLALAIGILTAVSCTQPPKTKTTSQVTKIDRVQLSAFQNFVDSALLEGSILIFDADSQEYYSNDFHWADSGHIPASTFKIPNSIIGLETGAVSSDTALFIWDGAPRRLKTWEADLTLKQAFHKSCLPCYQEAARKVGEKAMRSWLDSLHYGRMLFDSATLDEFWLQGPSTISQVQQIDFLLRLYKRELPISQRTQTLMEQLMVIHSDSISQLSGKTGWSVNDDKDNGWFVGQYIYHGRTLYFATNVSPKPEMDLNNFSAARKIVSQLALDYVFAHH